MWDLVDEIDTTELEQFLVASIPDAEHEVFAKQDLISELQPVARAGNRGGLYRRRIHMSFPPDVPPQWSTRSGGSGKGGERRRRLAVIACLVLVALLTACGSDDDGGGTSTTTTTAGPTTTADRGDDVDPNGPDGPDDPGTETTVPEPDPEPDPEPVPDPNADLTDFEERYVADLVGDMDAMTFPSSVDFTCLATAWVSAIGGDRLEAAGLSAEEFVQDGPGDLNLDRDSAELMHRGSLACGLDRTALVVSAVGGDPDQECVEAITPELFEEAMVNVYMGDSDSAAAEQVDAILEDCSMVSGP